MDINAALVQWFIIYLIKKTSGSGIIQNQELGEELHKPIIRKIGKRRVYSFFKDNIWGVDLVDMQLVSKFDKGVVGCQSSPN